MASVEDAARALLGASAGDANRMAFVYRQDMVGRNLSAATVNQRMAALRSLVKVARLHGLVTWTLEVGGVKSKSYRDTRGPGPMAVRALLNAHYQPSKPREFRDYAILRLLTDLALRRGELTSLDLEHFDAEGSRLFVRGKGDSGRVPVTMPGVTRAAVMKWIEQRGPAAGPLFASRYGTSGWGRRLDGKAVARIVARCARKAGLDPIRPHGLRHSAITQALEVTGGNVRAVQRFSRHADLRTVLVYDDARADLGGEVAGKVAVW